MSLVIRIAKRHDSAFLAWCPALPGCAVIAQTAGEARVRVKAAVKGYVSRLDEALPRELGRLAGGHRAA